MRYAFQRNGNTGPVWNPLHADAHLVPRPQRAQGAVVDYRLAIAFHFNDCRRLVRRNQWQARESQGEFVLYELDLLAAFESRAESAFGFNPAMATTTSGS